MKKVYSKPEVQVVKLNIEPLLLPVSNTEVESGFSRGASFDDWGENEE